MQDLRVLLVQNDTIWQAPEKNLEHLREAVSKAPEADIIVLPEMFNTGFSMESKQLAEPMDGLTHRWMLSEAKNLNSVICGSVIIKKADDFFNRFLWVNPEGLTISYDKRHLFRMADEHKHFTAGHRNITIDHLGWKIRPQVCYDLRFPVWSRNRMIDGQYAYDILLNVANWPAPRVMAWDTLLKARAMENHAYMIGVNRVGTDGNNKAYSGHSAVYDPKGKDVLFLEDKATAKVAQLNFSELERYRQQFPAQLDADDFELI